MNDPGVIRKRNLARLVTPAFIAVIGASDDPMRIGGRPIDFSVRHDYKGAIYPVNPKREMAQGLTAYPTISDVPEAAEKEAVRFGGKLVLKIASPDIAHKTEIGGVLPEGQGAVAIDALIVPSANRKVRPQ